MDVTRGMLDLRTLLWAPLVTPKHILSRLNQSVARILQKPEIEERLRKDGMDDAYDTPEEFSRFIQADIAKWIKVVIFIPASRASSSQPDGPSSDSATPAASATSTDRGTALDRARSPR